MATLSGSYGAGQISDRRPMVIAQVPTVMALALRKLMDAGEEAGRAGRNASNSSELERAFINLERGVSRARDEPN